MPQQDEAPDTAVAVALLVLAVVAWGSYPPVRNSAPEVPGPPFALVSFFAELVFALVACSTSSSDFFDEFAQDVRENTNACLLIVLGGAFVGTGDLLAMSALQHVPGSLAFPIIVGTCTAVGTTLSYFLDGNPNPELLFTGIALFVLSVGLLGYAEGLPPRSQDEGETGVQATKATAPEDEETAGRGGGGKTPAGEDAVEGSSRKWVILLVVIGAIDSLWGPLSTVGRRKVAVRSAYLLVTFGRVGVQPIGQAIGPRRATVVREALCDTARRGQAAALVCGLLIGCGYYGYFLGSTGLNKSAAFAITNCAPLWTIFVGVSCLGDLQRYSNRARLLVASSSLSFVLAVAVLTLSSVL